MAFSSPGYFFKNRLIHYYYTLAMLQLCFSKKKDGILKIHNGIKVMRQRTSAASPA
jgi:hypothetical protein